MLKVNFNLAKGREPLKYITFDMQKNLPLPNILSFIYGKSSFTIGVVDQEKLKVAL